MKLGDKTKYKDANGRNFRIGDIVFNPLMCDYWLVEHSENPEDCPIILTLYGFKDIYYMYIDEQCDFTIEKSYGEEGYSELQKRMKDTARAMKRDMGYDYIK